MSTNTTSTSPRHFLTHLLSSLPSAPPSPSAPQNPLQNLPASHKNLFVTLHVLFPNDFLPALDLLDRRLVTRFLILSSPDDDVTNDDEEAQPVARNTERKRERKTLYYVQSAQQQHHHHHHQRRSRYISSHDTTTQSYEVRLGAWNCSCPAFAFAAFPAVSGNRAGGAAMAGEHAEDDASAGFEGAGEEGWGFGGRRRGRGLAPVCKHLLACLLVDRSDLFAGCAEEKRVSIEEAAGWAAGWAG
ncbi:hypothetical protein K490DRAFT_68504 [Saccharata proteae CBS 121410]|uniref:SWIM-type domain-containing protein n=1 Tax=Saccharata proteae CBS 121410 TaxID=1314787 RepID=A0A9P4LX86_9PEZI|nr:hypothetical protein K490DRAFT_68504 [Saccharata proteae CBS 121410]